LTKKLFTVISVVVSFCPVLREKASFCVGSRLYLQSRKYGIDAAGVCPFVRSDGVCH